MEKIKEYIRSLGRKKEIFSEAYPGETNRSSGEKEKEEDTIVFKKAKKTGPIIKETLVVTAGVDSGREFLLIPSPMKIGRHIENYINLTDPKVSREHALLEFNSVKKQFILKDLSSTNGTYLNDHRISKEERVKPGDTIRIGDTTLEMNIITK